MSKKTEYKQKNEQYMLDLQNKEGIHKLPKGILYEVLAAGSGSQNPGLRSIVTCNYKGYLINGHVFDDSWQRGYPEAFRVSDLIEGWQIALQAMTPGDKWKFYIPYQMGYGMGHRDRYLDSLFRVDEPVPRDFCLPFFYYLIIYVL